MSQPAFARRRMTSRPCFEPLEERRLLSLDQIPVQVQLETTIIEVTQSGVADWLDIDGDMIRLKVNWWNKQQDNSGIIGIDADNNTEFITLDDAARSVNITVKRHNGGDGRFSLGQFWAPQIRSYNAPNVDYIGGSEHPFAGGLHIGLTDRINVGYFYNDTELEVAAGGTRGLNARVAGAETTGPFTFDNFTRTFRLGSDFFAGSLDFADGVGSFVTRDGVGVAADFHIGGPTTGTLRSFIAGSLDTGDFNLVTQPRVLKVGDIELPAILTLPCGALKLSIADIYGAVDADSDTNVVKAGNVEGTLDLYRARTVSLLNLPGLFNLRHESQDADDYGARKINIREHVEGGSFNSQSSIQNFIITGFVDHGTIYLGVDAAFGTNDPIPQDGMGVLRPSSNVHLDKFVVKGRDGACAMFQSRVIVPEGRTMLLGKLFDGNEIGQARFGSVKFLADIPVVGHLFRGNEGAQALEQNLLVFLTPHILHDSR